jgi:galactose mutarotase-like enzyme
VFAIALKQDQYLTYILSDSEALSRLEVVPERGGIITRWKIQGQDILYLDEERFVNPELSVRGGIPILFPICGNLPDNCYQHGGKTYTLKQHGFARDLPWEVVQQGTDSCASLTLILASSQQTREVYPFDFQLSFTYQLQGNRLRLQQRYTNYSSERMPFSTGLHPYFWIGDKRQLAFDIPASVYQDQKTGEFFQFSENFDFDCPEIDVAFPSLTRHITSLTDQQRLLRLELTYSDLYSTLVFWTLKGKDYVCLEPWSAPRNSLNTGEQLTYIEPEETCEAAVEFNVAYL